MKTLSLAALIGAALLAGSVAAPVAAQKATPDPFAVAQAPATGPATTQKPGIAPSAVVAWLTIQGVTPGAVQEAGQRRFVRVDADGLAWLLFFQSCEGTGQSLICSDLQFSTGAQGTGVTPESINGWNRDRRFLKAIYEAPEGTTPASAVVQFDVLIGAGGPEQLTDYLAIWRGLLPEFAQMTVGGAAIAPATATPGQ